MNKKFATIGFVLIAIAIGSTGIQSVSAFEIPIIGGILDQGLFAIFGGYEKTLLVEYVEVQPAEGTDSYFFVYGIDADTGEERILELQNGSLSTLFNQGKVLDGLLNLDLLKYKVMKNVGNTITFECNGADGWGVFMETYPQCFRIISIDGEEHLPVISIAELNHLVQ